MVDSTALFMIAMQGWEWLIIHEADRYAKFQPKQKPLMKFIDPNLDSSSTPYSRVNDTHDPHGHVGLKA